MNKCYIRRKDTNRWLRFKELECYTRWDNTHNLKVSVESYHEERGTEEPQTYQVTQDKKKIIEVEVKEYLEPHYYASIL